jgi:hypothetical protein
MLMKKFMVLGHHIADLVEFEKIAPQHEFRKKPYAFRFFFSILIQQLGMFSRSIYHADEEISGPGSPYSRNRLTLNFGFG